MHLKQKPQQQNTIKPWGVSTTLHLQGRKTGSCPREFWLLGDEEKPPMGVSGGEKVDDTNIYIWVFPLKESPRWTDYCWYVDTKCPKNHIYIWVLNQKIGVFPLTWMMKIMENTLFFNGWFGGENPLFSETSTYTLPEN